MPFVDDVNRVLREFEGYTGDGQGGVGALPVGDRSTARKPISKRDLRELLVQMAQTMGDPSALQSLINQLGEQGEALAGKADASQLAAEVSARQAHVANTNNPHGTTKAQVGLGNVDNTSDANKPISAAQAAALEEQARRIDGVSAAVAWLAEFHPGPDDVDYAWVDTGERIIFGWQQDGTFTYGGGGSDTSEAVAELQVDVAAIQVDISALQGGLSVASGSIATLQADVSDLGGQLDALGQAQQFGFAVFGTVSEGLAATSDGDFFAVSVAESSVFQTLYRNTGGTAAFINRVPQPELAPFSEALVDPGQVYRDQGRVVVRRKYNQNLWNPQGNPSHYSTFPSDIFQTHTDLHALYDNLASDHANYISMAVLGTDALGNQIREYTAKPPAWQVAGWTPAEVALPKIVLQCGTHGSERVQFLTMLQILDDLANGWQQHPDLEKLRWGCEIVIIPTICPTGLDAGTRKNHNGVDLNRNNNWQWSTSGSTDPSSSSYRGPSAGSEAETQIAMGLTARHSNAIGIVDFHNHTSPTNEGRVTWLGTSRKSELGVALEVLSDMQVYLERDFPTFNTGGAQYGRITQQGGGTMAGYWTNVGGLPGYLHETPRYWGQVSTLDLLRHNYRATASLIATIWRREMQARRIETDL